MKVSDYLTKYATLEFYNRVETKREIPKLEFVSIKLKPQDVESGSIGTALGSYRNCTHILQEFQYGKDSQYHNQYYRKIAYKRSHIKA